MNKKLTHSGNLIIIGFITAALALLWLVYKATTVETQFVVEGDYYAKEAAYNDLMAAKKAALELSDALNLKETETEVKLSLPPEISSKLTKGSVIFYCVPNSKLDVYAKLEAKEDGEFIFNKSDVIKGHNYIVKVSFTAEGKDYYKEFELL